MPLLKSEIDELKAVRLAMSEAEFNKWFDKSLIKQRLKKLFMQQQRLRCCYCRKFNDTTNNNIWDLEHILCEQIYPQFFATWENLSIACKACNIAKNQSDILLMPPGVVPPIVEIPSDSARYSIPHPHLDDWASHLSHVNYQIYSSNSSKGTELIQVCKLNKLATEIGGLTHDSVVAAIRVNYFASIGSPVDAALPSAQIVDRMALARDGQDELRIQTRLIELQRTLGKLERQAGLRSPDNAVAHARALLANKTASSTSQMSSGVGGPG